ncbi:MAG: hypothetical protein LQ349_003265 [Xanthoria aureola]|nr:MAG: hypothetical protein LQ349_003265 [Xanthoria aureola]
MSSPLSPSLPITLIIRFSLSIPDLPITISSPSITTPLSLLYYHIRPYIPSIYRTCAIRLIANGALLPSSKPLSTSLRLLHPSPSVKGKEKENPGPETIYIHCSINPTETLSASALAAEADHIVPSAFHLSESQHASPNNNNTSEPRGFDRLLSAGLSPSEITSLRSQFLAITAHNHTPDTMPSPSTMRRLEERWLDSSSFSGYENEEDDDDDRGALDDMLWGTVTGFFWPVGAAMWLIREEGVWSKRRQMAAVTGVLVNLAVGAMKMSSR